ncbi:MAG: hypothetical protein C0617_09670 [Desulfuromonas sp.]|uniref:helix-turn-helix domain-containing protein n=1 Tax=Desulfuromonas sp. TaxID=892 RepID=UPI000CB93AD1|nr:helix-turn-helix domain-containing protein [Desulfuromonas sp.]PLX83986.1 MAG: hypothetical protein C0617_09670 [Desulfuromonas sp.]
MTATETESIGASLRSRRLKLGLSLAEVAARTRVRQGFLQALEEERFEAFSAEAYLKGFLRSYAEALGMDSAPLLGRLEEQGAGSLWATPSPVPQPLSPAPLRSRRDRGRMVLPLLAAVLLVLGGAAWMFLSGGATGQATPQVPSAARLPSMSPPADGSAGPAEIPDASGGTSLAKAMPGPVRVGEPSATVGPEGGVTAEGEAAPQALPSIPPEGQTLRLEASPQEEKL